METTQEIAVRHSCNGGQGGKEALNFSFLLRQYLVGPNLSQQCQAQGIDLRAFLPGPPRRRVGSGQRLARLEVSTTGVDDFVVHGS